MRLDHIAYRVISIDDAQNFFKTFFGYKIADEFDIEFDDGSTVFCYAMEPPEKVCSMTPDMFTFSVDSSLFPRDVPFHLAPEIFISEGEPGSIVEQWIQNNGPGIHHLAYEVEFNVKDTMEDWLKDGAKFLTEEPLICPGLIQVFTEPNPITGLIYELIQRTDKGFCKENVKGLMESTNG